MKGWGYYGLQAAIAECHAVAPSFAETDWRRILRLYDALVELAPSAVVRLNRAVAIGEADGPRAGLAELATLDPSLPRYTAASAYLHEKDGDLATAAHRYAQAASQATNAAERDHLTKQAARLNARD